MIVKKHGFTKDDLDRFAFSSHAKAKAATEAGAFESEILALQIETPEGMVMHRIDEGIRFDATLEGIAGVKLLQEGGSITAAQFIKRFVKPGVKWAHLDIAGMVWASKAGGLHDKGATGYGGCRWAMPMTG